MVLVLTLSDTVGLGLEDASLGLDLGLDTAGLGLGLGTSGLDYKTAIQTGISEHPSEQCGVTGSPSCARQLYLTVLRL